MSRASPNEKRLFSSFRRTCEAHELLAAEDRVLVAVSGGKDSHVLLHFLCELQHSLKTPFALCAVHLDQQQPGYDGTELVHYLGKLGVRFEILSEDTYSAVTALVPAGKAYCSLCSRLRRGILYTAAARLGCNKIALGHHREDALETLLLNLFYAGRLQAMPPKYTTDDGRFEVIRPLIECEEARIAELAREKGFPILPCNLCGSQEGLKRERMRELLDELERENPNVRAIMLNAIRNVRPTHLLDRDVQAAWQRRPAEVRPAPGPGARSPRARALPVVTSSRPSDAS